MRGPPPFVGVFVGGAASRMGGRAKGLLPTRSGVSVVERLLVEVRAAFGDAPICLVGRNSEYESLGLPQLADVPSGIGPLGGLHALLLEAERSGHEHVLSLACDLPYVSSELLERLHRKATVLQGGAATETHRGATTTAHRATSETHGSTTTEQRGRRAIAAVAPKVHGVWQPLCASWRVKPCLRAVRELIDDGQRALFRALDAVDAEPLDLHTDEIGLLRDWDTPEDMTR